MEYSFKLRTLSSKYPPSAVSRNQELGCSLWQIKTLPCCAIPEETALLKVGEDAENIKNKHAVEVVSYVLGDHILIVLDGEEL